MQVFQLSGSTNWNKICQDIKKMWQHKSPLIVRTADGKTIFSTHGSRDGSIEFQEIANMVKPDFIFACYLNTGRIIFTTIRRFIKPSTGEKVIFFIVLDPHERTLAEDNNYILAVCQKSMK